VAQPFVISFMTKMWRYLSLLTIEMLTHGNLQVEQMAPYGLPRLVYIG